MRSGSDRVRGRHASDAPPAPAPSIATASDFPRLPWNVPLAESVFLGRRGAPLVFAMHLGAHRADVRKVLEKHGGVLEDPHRTDVAHTRILLLDPEQRAGKLWIKGTDPKKSHTVVDAFHYDYVLECARRGKLLSDLSSYLVGKSRFNGTYDPLTVARGDTDWIKLGQRIGFADIDTASEDDEGEVCSDFEDDPTASRTQHGGFKSGRSPYLKTEQEEILRYIVRHKSYGQLKGNRLWQKMAHKVCGGRRSWQSIKEHYKKTLRNNLKAFALGAEVVSMLERGWAGDYVNESEEEEDDTSSSEEEQEEQEAEAQMTSCDGGDLEKENGETSQSSSSSSNGGDSEAPPALRSSGQKSTSKDSEDAGTESTDVIIPTPKKRPARVKPLFHKASQGLFEEVVDSGRRRRPNAPPSPEKSKSRASEPVEDPVASSSPLSSSAKKRSSLRTITNSPKPARQDTEDSSSTDFVINLPSPHKSKVRATKQTTTFTEETTSSADFVVTSPHNKDRRAKKKRRNYNEDITDDDSDIDSNETTLSLRTPYTPEEDELLRRYIEDNGLYHLHRGTLIWKRMEKESLLLGRSWQSMKNRFLKNVSSQINVRASRKNACEEGSIAKEISSENKFYTLEEDQKILRFILDNERTGDVKGIALWDLMYERSVLSRSAQSMKERFRKTIMKKLGRYDLTDAERRKFEK